MKELIIFYFKPYSFNKNHNYDNFFRNSLILYFITIIFYSFTSFIFLDDATVSASPMSNHITFMLIKIISLLLKGPIQILFLTIGLYILFSLIIKQKYSFLLFYKLLFISFNIVIIAYFIDTVNIFTKYYLDFYLINVFRISLNDIFIKIYDCSQSITSFLSRLNLLLLLSLLYSFFLFKSVLQLPNNRLLMLVIPISVLLILILFSSIPMFLLSIFKFAST